MASLNTLRTKFGMVLSIIIALALLAFILSLKTEMGFSGNDPKVGEIAGEKIRYSEYYNEYERIKSQNNIQESDEQQSAMLANAVWQSLFAKHVMTPGFSKLGLRVSDAERLGMISGRIPSQTLYNAFADPTTGQYDVAAVSEFLMQAETNPQAQQAWMQLNEQLRAEREAQKYYGLLRNGVFINRLEVEEGVEGMNKAYTGKWIGKRYAAVPDSLISVTAADLKAYYKAHKNNYKQTPHRTLSYVLFEVTPTDADLQALEEKVYAVGNEFALTDDLRGYVRANAHGSIVDRYLSAAQLPSDEAEALLAGKTYGPVLKNNEWTMSRVLDVKTAPDSLGLRHIVLSYTDRALADSLMGVLRKGGNFAQLAQQYSLYGATAANGGEIGVMPFSAFSGEFAEKLAGTKAGDVVEIESGDAIQLVQVYKAGKPQKHLQVASIVYPLEASDATRGDAHNQAGTFSVKAKGSLEAFNAAAADAAVTPRIATLAEGERLVRGLEDSREVVRWAFGAKKGDVSEIFNVGKDYVIAILTGIDEEEYTPLKDVQAQVRAQVMRDKKYDYIVNELAGTTLEEQAESLGSEVADFNGVTLNSYFVDGIGYEPRVMGAIATSEGSVSAPVKGQTGVFVVQVEMEKSSDKQTAEGEKVRAQATAENMVQRLAVPAIQQMAEIRDLRGKYF